MPQLMPLSWMFSSLMIFVIVLSMSFIYGESININNMESEMKKEVKGMNYWCW